MLTLGISTSSSRFAILFGEDGQVLLNSEKVELPETREISELFTHCLTAINRKVSDIGNIIVDNGPGGTSSVRTGVAFGNALAYSLGISVCPISSFEILGLTIYREKELPVILTSKSIKGNAFVGYFNRGRLETVKYGQIDEIVPSLVNDIEEFSAAGFYKQKIQELLPEKTIHLSDKLCGNVEALVEDEQLFIDRALTFPHFVMPITENSLPSISTPTTDSSNSTDTTDIIESLNQGGVALLPTDTVYGLAVKPISEEVISKIYKLKSRPRTMFLPIMVASKADLETLGLSITEAADKLLQSKFMPGAVTIALGFDETKVKPEWLTGRDEIAVRIPNDKVLLEILRKTGPLLVTSANRNGVKSTPNNIAEILEQLDGTPDTITDGGVAKEVPSTLVNCRVEPPVIERVGVVLEQEILEVLK